MPCGNSGGGCVHAMYVHAPVYNGRAYIETGAVLYIATMYKL